MTNIQQSFMSLIMISGLIVAPQARANFTFSADVDRFQSGGNTKWYIYVFSDSDSIGDVIFYQALGVGTPCIYDPPGGQTYLPNNCGSGSVADYSPLYHAGIDLPAIIYNGEQLCVYATHRQVHWGTTFPDEMFTTYPNVCRSNPWYE